MCDIGQARDFVETFLTEDGDPIRSYYCHMGLIDYSYVIRVAGKPIGVMLAGQFGTAENRQGIRDRVESIALGEDPNIEFRERDVVDALYAEIDGFGSVPENFEQAIQKEGELIESLAEGYYQKRKTEREHRFFDELRNARHFHRPESFQEIRTETQLLLDLIREFCGIEYVLFFTNINPHDTVLTPLAQSGMDAADELPHFNWNKAGLARSSDTSDRKMLIKGDPGLARGIRPSTTAVSSAVCAVSSMLGQVYHAAMVFGPFEQLDDPKAEEAFFFQINRIIGWYVYARLQSWRLQIEESQLEAQGKLLQHRFRTALVPITTHIGIARFYLGDYFPDLKKLETARGSLDAAHDLALRLGKASRETARSADIMVESADLRIDVYPLSVLVANCAAGFAERARESGRRLNVESSVEALPSAHVDIGRLTIAISNVLDNAVKYSSARSLITVRSLPIRVARDQPTYAAVQIVDFGEQIPAEKIEEIFERGQRGLAKAKLKEIPGTGYGLWEAKAIVLAHGGLIEATSTPQRRSGRRRIHRVVFTLKIPLQQPSGQ